MKTGTGKQVRWDNKSDQKALVISLFTFGDVYIMLQRFSYRSKQAESRLFKVSYIAETIFSM